MKYNKTRQIKRNYVTMFAVRGLNDAFLHVCVAKRERAVESWMAGAGSECC